MMQNFKMRLKILKRKYFPTAESKLSYEKSKEFYSKLIPLKSLVFDVGANIGDRVSVFQKIGLSVIAIEPQDYCNKYLVARFDEKLNLERVALGAREGEGDIFISNANTLSSMSKKWIDKVSEKRFGEYNWNKTEKIRITTLDKLIKKYGLPYYCKIDVEGYEFEVIKGLTQSIPLISFEYAIPESIENVVNCINHLAKLGTIECNYSNGESFIFGSEKWLTQSATIELIENHFEKNNNMEGDIYIRYL